MPVCDMASKAEHPRAAPRPNAADRYARMPLAFSLVAFRINTEPLVRAGLSEKFCDAVASVQGSHWCGACPNFSRDRKAKSRIKDALNLIIRNRAGWP